MKVIARIENPYQEKFGIPRQSSLAEHVTSRIVFEPEYRIPEAFRGLEEFSHLWLLWCFSENAEAGWSPTVRPPVLGGNVRKGVFATRSPFRPNPIGLSCVKILSVVPDAPDGACITVAGADLMNGTPIYDIKPYIPYTDCRPEAQGSFAEENKDSRLEVLLPEELAGSIPSELKEGLLELLSLDPRPRYQQDPERVYGCSFGGLEVHFQVEGGRLRVTDIS